MWSCTSYLCRVADHLDAIDQRPHQEGILKPIDEEEDAEEEKEEEEGGEEGEGVEMKSKKDHRRREKDGEEAGEEEVEKEAVEVEGEAVELKSKKDRGEEAGEEVEEEAVGPKSKKVHYQTGEEEVEAERKRDLVVVGLLLCVSACRVSIYTIYVSSDKRQEKIEEERLKARTRKTSSDRRLCIRCGGSTLSPLQLMERRIEGSRG
jgi:hypothetical protein